MDFFDRPILNSPYDYPSKHWELDESGQPTQSINDTRRPSSLITPVPRARTRRRRGGRDDGQIDMVMDAGDNISTAEQEYNISGHINDIRRMVDDWRRPKRFTRTEKYFYPLITDFSGYISEARLSKAGLSVARDAASRILCLPIYPDLPDTVVHKIIEVIKKAC
jgi:hypothetical protein